MRRCAAPASVFLLIFRFPFSLVWHCAGAGASSVSGSCSGNQNLQNCLEWYGLNLTCYASFSGCSQDPDYVASTSTLRTYYSFSSMNADGNRHLAMFKTSVGTVLAWNDIWYLSSPTYRSVMILITSNATFSNTIPGLCDPACNSDYGTCDTSTGTCKCVSAATGTFTSTCDCKDVTKSCPNCSTHGTCKCDTGTCVCDAGYYSSSASAQDCRCSSDYGLCYGARTNWTCDTCYCTNSSYTNGNVTIPGGLYKINFGLKTSGRPSDYLADYGLALSSTSLYSYGWSVTQTAYAFQTAASTDTTDSGIQILKNANWTLYLAANTLYDVTVTLGSTSQTTNTIYVNGNLLVNAVTLAPANYTSWTIRVSSGSTGAISFGPGSTTTLATTINEVIVSIPPCGCTTCPKSCGAGGTCTCLSGCTCQTGFVRDSAGACTQCATGYYGPTCQPCQCQGTAICNSTISGDGTCTCPTGYTGTTCSTCAANYYGSTCQQCPACVSGQGTCNSGLTGNGTCSCSGNFVGTLCQSCKSNSGGSTCQTCPTCKNGVCWTGITGSGLCNCTSGFASSTTGGTTGVTNCDQCASGYYGASCTACSCGIGGTCNEGITANGSCTCRTGFTQLTVGGSCDTCASGYYLSGTTCKACLSGCATCTSSSTCKVCTPPLLLQPGSKSCLSTCPTGYYSNGTTCLACASTCATCSSFNVCLTCDSASATPYLNGTNCVSTCPNGTYLSGTSCLACNSNCVTCKTTSTTCTSCKAGMYLNVLTNTCVTSCPTNYVGSNGVCDCAVNYYGATCTACNCGLGGTCDDGATGSGNCTCNTGYKQTTVNGPCNTCASGYFLSGTTCVACPANCTTCSSATVCTQCAGTLLVQPGSASCASGCPTSYYSNGVSYLACDTSCLTCSGAGANLCVTCNATSTLRYLSGSTCVSSCPSGTYASASRVCTACNSNCATCITSSKNCTSCTSPLLLFIANATCVSSCPSGYSANGTVCAQCAANKYGPSCLACNCGIGGVCDQGITGTGSCTCTTGYTQATAGAACNTCASGYFLSGSTCVACFSGCATCASTTTCTVCSSGLLLQPGGTSCGSSCPSGYYSNGTACVACGSTCATCSSGTGCLTCSSTSSTPYLNGTSCVSTCPSGTYLSGTSCLACNSNCKTCSGTSTTCTSCPSGQVLNTLTDTCDATCPTGFTSVNSVCNQCLSGYYGSSCTACSCGLSGGSCSDGITGTGYCTCATGYSQATAGAACSSCSSSYYQSGTTCVACLSNCTTCADGTSCSQCAGSLVVQPGGGSCASGCPTGYYSNGVSCLACDSSCLTCSGAGSSARACRARARRRSLTFLGRRAFRLARAGRTFLGTFAALAASTARRAT